MRRPLKLTLAKHLQGTKRRDHLCPPFLPRPARRLLLALRRRPNFQLVHPKGARHPTRLLQRLGRRRRHVLGYPSSRPVP